MNKKLAFGSLFLFCGWVFAADVKLGFVDLHQVMQTVEEGKIVKSKLEKDFGAMKERLEKQQAGLQKEFEEFEKKAAILNEKAKAEKQADLQKRFMEFQRKAQESNLELKKLETSLTEPILKELRLVVEALGKEQAFSMVFEKNEAAVLYSTNGTDLTDAVIKRFNDTSKKRKKG